MAGGHFSKVFPRDGRVEMMSGHALIVFLTRNRILCRELIPPTLLLFATQGAPPTIVTNEAGMCLV